MNHISCKKNNFKYLVRKMLINKLKIGLLLAAMMMTSGLIAVESNENETTDVFMERNLSLLSGEITIDPEEETIFDEERSAFDEAVQDQDGIFKERPFKKHKSFLFERIQGAGYQHGQNLDESTRVYEELVSHSLPKIVFKQEKIWPFDYQGVCSAMALDFLARYFTTCRNCFTNEETMSAQIAQFNAYYKVPTAMIISRQAAYNTITVEDDEGLDAEELKYRKIQSLANYHNIHLEPITGSIPLQNIESGQVDFKKIITQLPQGSYVIRALSPTDNDKKEWYGHTMILIKKKGFSIFFDNAKGAAKITEETDSELGEHLEAALVTWHIPEYRIYRARMGAGGCKNLSTEEASALDYTYPAP